MTGSFIDLHVHTTASDGTFTPAEVIQIAKKAGLKAIAITDHDTVDGIKDVIESSNSNDIEIIPGIEVSVDFEPEMHLLGYFIDINSIELADTIKKIRNQRFSEVIKVIFKLRSLGIEINPKEVQGLAGSLNVYSIANLIISKGYAKNWEDVLDKFLGVGKPAFVQKKRLSPCDAIKIIKGAGGVCFLAHPHLLRKSDEQLEKVLDDLLAYGIDGVECYHPLCSKEKQELFIRMSKERGLLISGGSDFHGKTKPGIDIGRGYGDLKIPYEIVVSMKSKRT
jgi:predicted metal-dependent phosphoesterase TrpH